MTITDLLRAAETGNAHAARLVVRHYARRIAEACERASKYPDMRRTWAGLALNWVLLLNRLCARVWPAGAPAGVVVMRWRAELAVDAIGGDL